MLGTEDRLELRAMADRYCSAVDDGDAAGMTALFVPAGRLVVYEPGATTPLRVWDGEAGFQRLLSVLRDRYRRTFHMIGNHWCEATGEGARGETYCLACHLRETSAGDQEEVAVIRYRDQYVRTAGGWRFSERAAHRQWTTVRPVSTARHEIDTALAGER